MVCNKAVSATGSLLSPSQRQNDWPASHWTIVGQSESKPSVQPLGTELTDGWSQWVEAKSTVKTTFTLTDCTLPSVPFYLQFSYAVTREGKTECMCVQSYGCKESGGSRFSEWGIFFFNEQTECLSQMTFLNKLWLNIFIPYICTSWLVVCLSTCWTGGLSRVAVYYIAKGVVVNHEQFKYIYI